MSAVSKYGLKELRDLLRLTAAPHAEDHDFEHDRYGDRLVVYLIAGDGVRLSVADDLSWREIEGLTGYSDSTLQKTAQMTKAGVRIWSRPNGVVLLPFPFTIQQAVQFDKEAGGVIAECLDFGDDTDKVIAGLPAKSAELARSLRQPTDATKPPMPAAADLLKEHRRLSASGKNATKEQSIKYGLSTRYIRRRVSEAKTAESHGSPVLANVSAQLKTPK